MDIFKFTCRKITIIILIEMMKCKECLKLAQLISEHLPFISFALAHQYLSGFLLRCALATIEHKQQNFFTGRVPIAHCPNAHPTEREPAAISLRWHRTRRKLNNHKPTVFLSLAEAERQKKIGTMNDRKWSVECKHSDTWHSNRSKIYCQFY